jgi:hypothetical protein
MWLLPNHHRLANKFKLVVLMTACHYSIHCGRASELLLLSLNVYSGVLRN